MSHHWIRGTGLLTIFAGIIVSFANSNENGSPTYPLLIWTIVGGVLMMGFAQLIESVRNIELKICGNGGPESDNKMVPDKIKRFRGDIPDLDSKIEGEPDKG